jgi:hypothetical protein
MYKCVCLAVSCLIVTRAIPAHDTVADSDAHVDWIQGIVNSEHVPCCGNNDCFALRANALEIAPDGAFTVEIRGHWFPVPERNVLRDKSPDGRPWVCPEQEPTTSGGYIYSVKGVRCLLLPMGV